MIESDMQVVLAMLLYFVVVVVIGFVYAKRSNSSSEEYFLGGRGLGPWLTALSAEASDMSGWYPLQGSLHLHRDLHITHQESYPILMILHFHRLLC